MRLLVAAFLILAAGCATPSEPAQVSTDPQPPAWSGPVTHAFSWQGYFHTGARWEVGGPLPAGGSVVPQGTSLIQPFDGNSVTQFALNVTWAPSSPTTQTLHVWVMSYDSCGNGCFQFAEGLAFDGASPLNARGDIAKGDHDGVAVYVFPDSQVPNGAAYVAAVLDQAWSVDGTFVTQ
ncbi:MAG: hypothetical protein V4510_04890 [bacterium]